MHYTSPAQSTSPARFVDVARRGAAAFAAWTLFILAAPTLATAQATPVTIEGCLAPGDRPGYFSFIDDATGGTVTVAGLPDLAQHASNHRERVTGTFVREGGREILRATALEHVADSCAPIAQRVAQRAREVVEELRRRAVAFGVHGGFALDPELVVFGARVEFHPILDSLVFRPNVEFGVGEVTAEYAVNLEGVYRLPFLRENNNRLDVWNIYIGAGPSLTFYNQEFRERDYSDDPVEGGLEFDDWDTTVGFNVLVGLTRRNGFFTELKAGAYGNPDIRMLVGYTF